MQALNLYFNPYFLCDKRLHRRNENSFFTKMKEGC